MKKYSIPLIVLSVLGSSANAEPPTADLTVQGNITVPTCIATGADDGVYEIGEISPTRLSATATTTLTAITKTWTVTCDGSTFMNFTPVDNRTGTASTTGTNNFGLGTVNDTGRIGFYTILASNATVDGTTTRLFTSATSTISAGTTGTTTTLAPGSVTGWVLTSALTQASGTVFTVDLAVTPVLASTATMNGAITEEAEIDGSATLNFAYGI